MSLLNDMVAQMVEKKIDATLKAPIPVANMTAAERRRLETMKKNDIARAMDAAPDENYQTSITRMTLEGLCSRAGVKVEWSGNTPILSEDYKSHGGMSPKEQTLERRLRMLEQENARLQERLQKLNYNPASTKSIDDPNRLQVLEEQVEHLRQIKAEQEELKAKNELRARGANDADIEAVRKLLGAVPQEGELRASKEAKPFAAIIHSEKAMTLASLEAMVRQLDAQIVSVSGLKALLDSPVYGEFVGSVAKETK